MKKIVSILIIFSILFFDFSSVIAIDKIDDLPGKEAVIKCIEAYKKKGENTKQIISNITNPFNSKYNLSCAGNNIQEATYQAILDVRFSKIDKDIENYLKGLDGNTNTIKANQELSDHFSKIGEQNQFYYAYQKACGQIVPDAVKLLGIVNTSGDTSKFIGERDPNKCLGLASTKLKSYQEAGVVILARETKKSQENSWKKFFSTIRDKYEKLLMKFLNYISELGKISNKWNKSTPKAQTNP